MNYEFVTDVAMPWLGGNILEGDPLTFSPKVWDYLIDRFAIKSVLDVGSGLGYCANYFHSKGIATIAIDGLRSNILNAIYPTIWHDLMDGPFICNVDLVHCVEVVEHIEPNSIENILRTLANGKFTIMSHALPGQDGYHHVNCQLDDYWLDHVRIKGGRFLDIDTDRIRNIARNEGAHHLANSGLVFTNKSRL
jgi:SAM-dependent methyltransferase